MESTLRNCYNESCKYHTKRMKTNNCKLFVVDINEKGECEFNTKDIHLSTNKGKMEITHENNFCRVFELPIKYPEDFLFDGPKPVRFFMIDWFNPIPRNDIDQSKLKNWSEYEEMLKNFLGIKVYLKPNVKYLLITDFGKSFIFKK